MTLKNSDCEIAPCLNDGPLARPAGDLVAATRKLGDTISASSLRARCVVSLFDEMERIFAAGEEPTRAIHQSLEYLVTVLNVAASNPTGESNGNGKHSNTAQPYRAGVEAVTGEHYGRLFEAFSSTSYWDEPVSLLRDRLERNGIALAGLDQTEVLDAGCGGGRYTVAWRLLGAKQVTGIDVSPIGVSDARRRTAEAGITGVQFEEGNVLELPVRDSAFDIVFSNGVLHHTVNWEKGVHELVRVLKTDGLGWLYLIENPGGLFWDIIEVLRVVMRDESRDQARAAMQKLSIPANRIFYMLDHVMAPINVRLTPVEIEECLSTAGAKNIRRLTRGTDFDRIEQIHREEPFASQKYGVGENRYIFTK